MKLQMFWDKQLKQTTVLTWRGLRIQTTFIYLESDPKQQLVEVKGIIQTFWGDLRGNVKPSTCQLLDTRPAARSWSLCGPATTYSSYFAAAFLKSMFSFTLLFKGFGEVWCWTVIDSFTDCGRDFCMPHILSELTVTPTLQTPEHQMKLNDGSWFSQVSPVQVLLERTWGCSQDSPECPALKTHINDKQQ